jgi:hypothetical protein
MKSTPELEAEIVRLHYAEHWPVGTIATQLDAHVDQVRRVLGLDAPRAPSTLRPRVIDPYRPFIDEQLQRYPRLRATRPFATGGVAHLYLGSAADRHPPLARRSRSVPR